MLTFKEWKAKVDYTMSLGSHPLIQDEALKYTIGYVYPGGLFIEFKPENMSTTDDIWQYQVMDANDSGSARFIHELEKPLYGHYVAYEKHNELLAQREEELGNQVYVIADGAYWQYAWFKDRDEWSPDLDKEAMETIADMEIGQCYHENDLIIVRVLG